MAQGNLTADGSTVWFRCHTETGVRISAKGDFGGGTITLQNQLNSTTYSLLDESQTALTYTSNFDEFLKLRDGDVFRATLSGATSPDIDWFIGGAAESL